MQLTISDADAETAYGTAVPRRGSLRPESGAESFGGWQVTEQLFETPTSVLYLVRGQGGRGVRDGSVSPSGAGRRRHSMVGAVDSPSTAAVALAVTHGHRPREKSVDLGSALAEAAPAPPEYFARREAALQAAVPHPNILPVVDSGEAPAGGFYIVTPHGAGEEEVVRVAVQAGAALEAVHARGLVHRDVKPENLLVSWDGPGATLRLRLIDFGMCVQRQAGAGEGFAGTVHYCSPEQAGMIQRPIDARSDLYSLGAVLFECATGRPPFQAPSALELLLLHRSQPAPDAREVNPAVSERVAGLIAALLAKDPDDRPSRIDAGEWEGSPCSPGAPLGAPPDVHAAASLATAFAGREEAARALAEAWRAARATGRPATHVLLGPSGSGRTRLLLKLAADPAPPVAPPKNASPAPSGSPSASLGPVALFCRSEGVLGAAPRAPMAELRGAIRHLTMQIGRLPAAARAAATERVRAAAAPCRATLQRALPELGAASGDVAAYAVASFLCGLAAGFGGLLLAVDDLDAATPGTLDLLRELAAASAAAHARRAPLPLLLLLSSSPAALARRKESDAARGAEARRRSVTGDPAAVLEGKGESPLASLLAGPLVTRHELAPLAPGQVMALVRSALGERAVPPELGEVVWGKCAGSGAASLQFLFAAVDSGALVFRSAAWRLDAAAAWEAPAPAHAEATALARLDEAGPEERAVLRVAALVGSEFTLGALLAASARAPRRPGPGEAEGAAVRGALRGALRGRLLEEVAHRRFSQPGNPVAMQTAKFLAAGDDEEDGPGALASGTLSPAPGESDERESTDGHSADDAPAAERAPKSRSNSRDGAERRAEARAARLARRFRFLHHEPRAALLAEAEEEGAGAGAGSALGVHRRVARHLHAQEIAFHVQQSGLLEPGQGGVPAPPEEVAEAYEAVRAAGLALYRGLALDEAAECLEGARGALPERAAEDYELLAALGECCHAGRRFEAAREAFEAAHRTAQAQLAAEAAPPRPAGAPAPSFAAAAAAAAAGRPACAAPRARSASPRTPSPSTASLEESREHVARACAHAGLAPFSRGLWGALTGLLLLLFHLFLSRFLYARAVRRAGPVHEARARLRSKLAMYVNYVDIMRQRPEDALASIPRMLLFTNLAAPSIDFIATRVMLSFVLAKGGLTGAARRMLDSTDRAAAELGGDAQAAALRRIGEAVLEFYGAGGPGGAREADRAFFATFAECSRVVDWGVLTSISLAALDILLCLGRLREYWRLARLFAPRHLQEVPYYQALVGAGPVAAASEGGDPLLAAALLREYAAGLPAPGRPASAHLAHAYFLTAVMAALRSHRHRRLPGEVYAALRALPGGARIAEEAAAEGPEATGLVQGAVGGSGLSYRPGWPAELRALLKHVQACRWGAVTDQQILFLFHLHYAYAEGQLAGADRARGTGPLEAAIRRLRTAASIVRPPAPPRPPEEAQAADEPGAASRASPRRESRGRRRTRPLCRSPCVLLAQAQVRPHLLVLRAAVLRLRGRAEPAGRLLAEAEAAATGQNNLWALAALLKERRCWRRRRGAGSRRAPTRGRRWAWPRGRGCCGW
eukprot:tig00000821_g4528.t1